jgi:hypothetical protein
MAKPVVCGKCKEPMKKGERLKSHWRSLHSEDFVKVETWLGESEAKLRTAILVAGEGMKGPGAQGNVGPERYGVDMPIKGLEKISGMHPSKIAKAEREKDEDEYHEESRP